MLKKISWLFFTITLYSILADAVQPWMHLPKLDHVGFTIVFVLFSLVHCAVLEGQKRTTCFFAISAFTSYVMEEIGVRTGFIYGHYHYSNMLGPKLGSVPMMIPLAWFMMIYPSWRVAGVLARAIDSDSLLGRSTQALIAAMVMTAWDMVMDPGNTVAGLWVWERGGILDDEHSLEWKAAKSNCLQRILGITYHGVCVVCSSLHRCGSCSSTSVSCSLRHGNAGIISASVDLSDPTAQYSRQSG